MTFVVAGPFAGEESWLLRMSARSIALGKKEYDEGALLPEASVGTLGATRLWLPGC